MTKLFGMTIYWSLQPNTDDEEPTIHRIFRYNEHVHTVNDSCMTDDLCVGTVIRRVSLQTRDKIWIIGKVLYLTSSNFADGN